MTDLYFISKGTFKAFYLSENDSERIKSFLSEGDFIGSLQSLHRDVPSRFGVVALEDSELLRFDFQTLHTLAAEDLELSADLIQSLMDLASKKEQREYEFLCLSPEQRYQNLCEVAPDWFSRLTQADIALYLGIAPESLSRIRRRKTQATER